MQCPVCESYEIDCYDIDGHQSGEDFDEHWTCLEEDCDCQWDERYVFAGRTIIEE